MITGSEFLRRTLEHRARLPSLTRTQAYPRKLGSVSTAPVDAKRFGIGFNTGQKLGRKERTGQALKDHIGWLYE